MTKITIDRATVDQVARLLNDMEKGKAAPTLWQVRTLLDVLQKALEQPEQEPTCPKCKAGVLYECVACSSNNYPPKAQRKPLTDDHIWKLLLENEPTRYEAFRLCEAAHGIKEVAPPTVNRLPSDDTEGGAL